MPSPRVLVLVLNYNAGATLEECLRSLQQSTYPNAELLVLDNGSTDGSAEIPPRLGIKTHLFGENLGYSAAYNQAFRDLEGEADYFLISNPDLVVPPPTIERLVAAALSDDTIGFVGPLQRHTDSSSLRSAGVRWSCGRLPKHVERGDRYDYVEGAFLLVHRQVLDRVGGPDETLGMNYEDLDWQRRAAAVGFHSHIVSDAEVLHYPPGEVRRTTGSYYQSRNVCIVTSRYCRRGALTRVRMRLYAEGLIGTVLGRPRGPFILEGLRDFRRGVTGMKPTA